MELDETTFERKVKEFTVLTEVFRELYNQIEVLYRTKIRDKGDESPLHGFEPQRTGCHAVIYGRYS